MLHSSKRLPAHGACLAVFAIALLVAGCKTDPVVTGSVPLDYRERHPIRLMEGEHAIQILVGSNPADLTADQRAQVAQMAGSWRREATGFIAIDVPTRTPNARAAAYASRQARSVLQASGVPSHAIKTRNYQPPAAGEFGPIRIAYARIQAEAGPCGLWPEDVGASWSPRVGRNPASLENRTHWNFGCAGQHNLAVAVSNPEDLVQPRAETPPMAARRYETLERYRRGEDTASAGAPDAEITGAEQ